MRKISDLIEALENGIAEKESNDPYAKLIREEDINQKAKTIRDKSWNCISSLVVQENEPDIFIREKRGIMVKSIVEKYNVSFPTVYKWLRRYWQRGKNKNALLPDYKNSGGKGKCKVPGSKKLGRPRTNGSIKGKGINVDEATKKIFRIAVNKYYHTPKENYLTTAYNMMMKEFYTEDYIIDNGIKKPILIPEEQIPTMRQFRYWYQKERNVKKSIISRKSKKDYELNHRAVLGKSDTEVMGPGSIYQIDATVADVYLVSRYNRNWIIGRPIVYIVIDVFSRMVTGLYIGLEGPSWIGAMMALANATCDKVKFCSEYGINISKDDWPCYHLPDAILADNGEMKGKNVEVLINSLNIRVSNTPSYRADWKGIVEQNFRTLNIQVKPLTPGYINADFKKRGGRDYRLDAKLDLKQFAQIIIWCVLYHNNQRWLDNYNRSEMLIEDDIDSIPIELWKWGITNRSGKLRIIPKDIIKLNLMPTEKATVTAKGIRFKQMYYSCNKAIEEMWFEKARNKSSWKINISYDPRNMNYIYIRNDNGRSFEKCFLIEQNRYADRTLDEIMYLISYEKLKKDKKSTELQQSKVDLLSEIENVVNKAEKMAAEQQNSIESSSSKISGIREHRKNEKMLNRKIEAFELDSKEDDKTKLAEVIPINSDADEDYSYPSNIEFLKRKQKERLHGKEK